MRIRLNWPDYLLLFTLAACSKRSPPRIAPIPGLHLPQSDRGAWYLRQRDSLLALDPAAEASKALAMGDHHLLGLASLALIVPGAGPNWRAHHCDIFVFPGTSDAITSPNQSEYQEVVFEYAARYNTTILRSRVCGHG